jgi:hypothetical protein
MNKKVFWAALIVLVLGSSMFYMSSIGNGPDHEVLFVREVPSKLDAGYLDQVFQQIPTWSQWFFAATSSNEINGMGNPYPIGDQKLVPHAIVQMNFNPHRGENSKFQLTYEVLDYVPKKMLKLRVTRDSKNHLLKLFSDLEWTIELLPMSPESKTNPKMAQFNTMIRGTLTGHTATSKARIYSQLIPSVFLNQVFYPNLLVLTEINNPLAVVPYPESQ